MLIYQFYDTFTSSNLAIWIFTWDAKLMEKFMVEFLSINQLEELINFTSCGPFKYLQHVSLMCMILVSKEPLFYLWPVSFSVTLCKFFFFFLCPHIIFIFPKDIDFLDTTEIIYNFLYKRIILSSYYLLSKPFFPEVFSN